MSRRDKALLKSCLKDLAYHALRLLVLIVSVALFYLVVYGVMGIDIQ